MLAERGIQYSELVPCIMRDLPRDFSESLRTIEAYCEVLPAVTVLFCIRTAIVAKVPTTRRLRFRDCTNNVRPASNYLNGSMYTIALEE